MVQGCKAASSCPLSWSSLCLSPSLGAARDKRILPAMKQQRAPSAPAHSPRPLRCKASGARLSGQERSRDTPGQPSQQLPFKAQVSRGLPAWHSTESPRAAGHGNAHRRHGTETPRPPSREGRAAQGSGAELTFTPSFFLLPPLLPPGERRKEISRARQGTKTRRARISSMAVGARAAGAPGPAGGVRLLSSSPRRSPRELRGDLASAVLSYRGGSWPGA